MRERDLAREVMRQWVLSVRNREDSSGWKQPIVQNLATMSKVFNGYGQHTASDVLHELGIHPLTPTWRLFQDPKMRTLFFDTILEYSTRWVSKRFKQSCAVICNSDIPFAYNASSALYYFSFAVRVYRRCETRTNIKLVCKLWNSGMLDPNHVLGVFLSGLIYIY